MPGSYPTTLPSLTAAGREFLSRKWAKTVTQGDSAAEPRGAVLAFAHLHETEVERDFWRCQFAKRDCTDYVVLPDPTGKKSIGFLRVAGFLRQ